MRKSSWVILIVIAVLTIVLVVMNISSPPKLTGEEEIHVLLDNAGLAVEHKNIRAALSCVSDDYQDLAGNDYDQLRVLTIRALRSADRYHVTLDANSIHIDGKQANVELQVSVAVADLGGGEHAVFSGPMVLTLKKKPARSWLIIPTEKWMKTSKTNNPLAGGGLG